MRKYVIIILGILCIGVAFFSRAEAEKEKTYYKISKGDVLEISVYEEEDLSGEFEVKEGGTITYPLLGSVKVEGLTKLAIEEKLTTLLEKDYLVEPHVRVKMEEYHERTVLVLGSVKNPGSYEFPEDRPLTLLQVISMAGGYTRYASVKGTRIITTLPSGKKKTIDPKINDIIKGRKEDFELKPDDVVMVPERFF